MTWMTEMMNTRGSGLANGTVLSHADLYDLLFGDYSADISLYKSVIGSISPVLECGVGTGRVALALAEDGTHVVGIDNSRSMLARLRDRLSAEPTLRERVTVIEADLIDFTTGSEYQRILFPFMTLNYILDREDRVAFFRRVKAELSRDGELWLEAMAARTLPEMYLNDGILRKAFSLDRLDGSREFDLFRIVRFSQTSQLVEQDRYYHFYDSEGVQTREVVVTWRNRFLSFEEIEENLRVAGLKVAGVYGDHQFGAYGLDSEFTIVKAVHS